MATAGALQSDSAGQKFAGPVDPTDGTGKAWRGENIDETEGYADGIVVLYDDANAILAKADDAAVTLGTLRVLPIGFLVDDTAPDLADEGDIGLPRMTASRVIRSVPSASAGANAAILDDGAFTIGTDAVVVSGFLVDETAPDSADEGDVGAARMTASRVLRSVPSADAGASAAILDDAAFTPATTAVVMLGAFADETAPDSVDEGDGGALRMTLARVLRVALSTDAGASIAQAEDAAHTNGDSGLMVLAVRQAAPAALAGANNDYIPLTTDALGRLFTTRKGEYKTSFTLMEATPITDASGPTNISSVLGLGGFSALLVLLTVASKSVSAGTLNIYVQTSPDDGITWDDVISFTQLTAGAVANGSYVAKVVNVPTAGFTDRVVASGALAANSKVDYFCDQVRVRYVPAAFDADDTVTITVKALAWAA